MDIDRALHRVGIVVGGGVLLVGLGLAFLPGVAEGVPVGLLVGQLFGLVGLLLAGYLVRERYHAVPRITDVPEVEFPLSTPTPGDDLDEMVYRLTRLREATIEYRQQVREKVGEVAVAVIRNRDDCSREEAVAKIKDGTWTDVPAAANFFADGGGGSAPSMLTQLRRRLTDTETAYERQLRTTVAAIEGLARGDGFDGGADVRDTDDEPARGMRTNVLLSDEDSERVTPTTRYRALLATRHWTGITAFALAAVALGVLTAQPAVLLASVAALGVTGYSKLTAAPALTSLAVERHLSDASPQPGDAVDVTVTVENEGDAFLTDLRLVDRLPPTMRVVDGTARLGTALRPGQSATFEYTLVADRGVHTWPVQVIARDPSGALEREAFVDAEAELRCLPRLKTVVETPVRMQTSMYAGQVNTSTGGDGLEFFSVRDYRPGDPMRRIDWKTFARTGEFSTIDFREERAAKVVLMFDARDGAYVSPAPGEKHAVDRAVEAAYDVFASLNDGGHLVGFAAFDTVPLWLGPSTGDLHVERVRQLFVDHPALSPLPPGLLEKSGRYVDPMRHIRRQLPENTQIFLFSPLTEDFVYEVTRRLDGAGHLVTVISPDPTATRTVGQRLARLERQARVIRLREHGIRVIDWGADRPLRLEIEHATRRWSA